MFELQKAVEETRPTQSDCVHAMGFMQIRQLFQHIQDNGRMDKLKLLLTLTGILEVLKSDRKGRLFPRTMIIKRYC